MLENILFTIRVDCQHVFTSHLFVICRNHSMKIKIILGIGWFYQKMQILDTNAGFYSVSGFKRSNAGQTCLVQVT